MSSARLAGIHVCMAVKSYVRHDARVLKEAAALVDEGAEVSIVGFGDPPAEPTVRFTSVEKMQGSRHPVRVLRIIENLRRERQMNSAFLAAAVRVQADIYHAHDLNVAETLLKAAGRSSARFVFDAHELYLENAGLSPRELRRYRRLERVVMRSANLLVVPSQERAEVFVERYAEVHPLVVANTPRHSQIGAQPPAEALEAVADLGGKSVLLYQGGLGSDRGLEAVIAGMAHLSGQYHLVLQGPASLEKALRSVVEASGVSDRVSFWPAVPASDVVPWAAVADLGVVTYLPTTLNNLLCAPNKLFDYAAAGVPSVSADLPPVRAQYESRRFGLTFEPGDAQSFAAAVERAFADEGELRAMRERALFAARENAWEGQAERLVEAYAGLAGRAGSENTARSHSTRRAAVVVADNDLTHDARVRKEAGVLADAGFDVTCIGIVTESGQQHVEQAPFGRIERVEVARKKRRASDAEAGAASPSSGTVGASVYSGPLGALRHWVGRMRVSVLLYRAAREHSPQVAICCDLSTLLTGALLARRAGCAVIYDVHDLYTRQGRSGSRVFGMTYGTTERVLIRFVDAVITVAPLLARWLATRYGIDRPVVVYNGPSECMRSTPIVHDPVRLLFQGAYRPNRNLGDLVRAMDRLRGRAVLSLQGWGETEAELKRLVEDLELDDTVRFLDRCKPEDVVACARDHDVGVICYRGDTLNLEMAVPNKLLDYFGAGLAVAVSDLPALRTVVSELGCGVLIDPSTPETIATGLSMLVDDRQAIVKMRAASSRVCPEFAWPGQAERLVGLVGEVLSRRGASLPGEGGG